MSQKVKIHMFNDATILSNMQLCNVCEKEMRIETEESTKAIRINCPTPVTPRILNIL